MSALPAETPALEFEVPIIGIWSRRTGPLAVQRSIVTFAPGLECYQCRRMIRLRWVLFDNDLDLYRTEMEFREWVNRQAAQQRAHLVEIGTGWGASFRRVNLIYGSLPQAAQRSRSGREKPEDKMSKKILASIKELKARHESGNWQASAKVQHPSVAILAGELVHAFRAYGGTNYVEFTVTDPASKETYTLSLRRREGREASELVAIMKEALEHIAEGAGADAAEARLALIECGYEVKK